MRKINLKDLGPPSTPHEVRIQRHNGGDMLKKIGQPVVHLHKLNFDDLRSGKAERCPCTVGSSNQQARANCEICHGTGLITTAKSSTHWIGNDATVTTTPSDTPAPLFGGFSDPVITWIMEPDAPVDEFRLSESGILTKVSDAKGYAFWTPRMFDGDIIVDVILTTSGTSINEEHDRYEIKTVTPHTFRGWGQHTRNRNHIVGQQFEMAQLSPESNKRYYNVPIGGVDWDTI